MPIAASSAMNSATPISTDRWDGPVPPVLCEDSLIVAAIDQIVADYWARKPAAFIRSWCRFSSLATQPRYSFPVMKL